MSGFLHSRWIGVFLVLMLISSGVHADWKKQWKYVLEKAVTEMSQGADKAGVLVDDSKRLKSEAEQRYGQSMATQQHEAVGHYQQAKLAFERSMREYRQAEAEFQDLLDQIQPSSRGKVPKGALSGVRQQLQRVHKLTQRTAQAAADNFNRGVREFNKGARLYQGLAKDGSKVIQDHARSQAQQQSFQVKRMAGLTKLAMIKVRDQADRFEDPGCTRRLTDKYQAVMDLLESAQFAYRDATSFPADAEAKMDKGKELVAQAQTLSSGIQDDFEICTGQKRP